MAWPLAHLEGITVCAMDARRQQIYNAAFRSIGAEIVLAAAVFLLVYRKNGYDPD